MTCFKVRLVASLVWLGALAFSISTYTVFNDHFDRISRARQIARYGALPFQDFFDPGYFMTELSSAGLQLLLGDNLLGEMLLNTVFIASGVTVVFLLSRRISNSYPRGTRRRPSGPPVDAASLRLRQSALLPVGYRPVLALYRPSKCAAGRGTGGPASRSARCFATTPASTSVCGAVVAAIVLHWREPGVLARRIGLCAADGRAVLARGAASHRRVGNVWDAIDQIATYAVREKARTEISRAPRFSLGDLVGRVSIPPPAASVAVRWSQAVNDADRLEAESRYRPSCPDRHGHAGRQNAALHDERSVVRDHR